MMPFVIGVAGWKNSGKTTLTAALVAELSSRGLKVSTIKHAHHAFDIDHPGTDSRTHRDAGASEVAIVSSRRWALMHELHDEAEPGLDDMLARLSPCDVVLVEGFKRGTHPKIEARRTAAADRQPLAPDDPSVVAIAADHPVMDAQVPVFALEDVGAITEFILSLRNAGTSP